MTHYRLYYAPGACSLAVHIALEEIRAAGLAGYATTRLLLPAGDQRRAEFLAVNPRGHVPVLAYRLGEREGLLTETLAILQFLAARHPEAGLVLTAPEAAARAWEWLSWLATDVHAQAFMPVFYPGRYAQDARAKAEVEASGRAQLARAWTDLESRLPDTVLHHGYTLGAFSVVDAYLLVFYRWAKRYGFAPETHYPRWSALAARTRARETVQRVFAEERIGLDDPLPARPADPAAREQAA